MGEDFGSGLPAQELGEDFVFESDARSLQQILDHEELPPRPDPLSGLTPVHGGSKKGADCYDFFETKTGAVLFRPKRVNELSGAVKSGGKRRGFGRTLAEGITPHRRKPIEKLGDKLPKTETKRPALPPLIHRQSISERKHVPLVDRGQRSFLPRPTKGNGVRKELDFNEDFDFAKPTEPVGLKSGAKKNDQPSLAKKIMMRESLAGLPRASLTGLFRQSLTMAELDRMFEDDSTESFENLESRLKTPAKKHKSSPVLKLRTIDQSPPEEKNDDQVEIFEVQVEDEDLDEVHDASALMKRSRSIGNLLEESSENVVVLARSVSEENLPSMEKTAEPVGISTDDPFLKEAVENLDRHRQEQAQLDNQLFHLMTQSRKRREDFRAVWGVSPRSINQKRTVKTVLNVQNVGFSGDDLMDQYMEEGFTPSSKLHNFTGIETETGDLSLDEISFGAKVHIDIPVNFGSMKANIGDLHSPEIPENSNFKGSPTTPMVLRDISNKAKKELAALYFEEQE